MCLWDFLTSHSGSMGDLNIDFSNLNQIGIITHRYELVLWRFDTFWYSKENSLFCFCRLREWERESEELIEAMSTCQQVSRGAGGGKKTSCALTCLHSTPLKPRYRESRDLSGDLKTQLINLAKLLIEKWSTTSCQWDFLSIFFPLWP